MGFTLASKNGQTINHMMIVQHLQSGDYDYSDSQTIDGAWDDEKTEAWVIEHPAGEAAAKAEFMASVEWYWPREALEAAERGYTWPITLGFVVRVDADRSELDVWSKQQ